MDKQALLQYVQQKFKKKELKPFRVGDTVRVYVKIIEGEAHRVQAFEGIVIGFKGHAGGRTFTVRKISFGIGVERTFPLESPALEKVDVIRSGHARRAKLYYLRDRLGRSARLEEKEALSDSAGSSDGAAPAKPKITSAPVSQQELVAAEDK